MRRDYFKYVYIDCVICRFYIEIELWTFTFRCKFETGLYVTGAMENVEGLTESLPYT